MAREAMATRGGATPQGVVPRPPAVARPRRHDFTRAALTPGFDDNDSGDDEGQTDCYQEGCGQQVDEQEVLETRPVSGRGRKSVSDQVGTQGGRDVEDGSTAKSCKGGEPWGGEPSVVVSLAELEFSRCITQPDSPTSPVVPTTPPKRDAAKPLKPSSRPLAPSGKGKR